MIVLRKQTYISFTATQNIATAVVKWGGRRNKHKNIHIAFSRRVKMMTLHTLQHPTSCRCCTFLPDSVRRQQSYYSKGNCWWRETFVQSELTLAARMMLFGDWRAARSVRIFFRSLLVECSATGEIWLVSLRQQQRELSHSHSPVDSCAFARLPRSGDA